MAHIYLHTHKMRYIYMHTYIYTKTFTDFMGCPWRDYSHYINFNRLIRISTCNCHFQYLRHAEEIHQLMQYLNIWLIQYQKHHQKYNIQTSWSTKYSNSINFSNETNNSFRSMLFHFQLLVIFIFIVISKILFALLFLTWKFLCCILCGNKCMT